MFTNEARPKEPDTTHRNASLSFYHYTKPSKYLFQWSRFYQALISQAGTYLLTKKFHTKECGIFKTEGGCNIVDVGEFVLCDEYCYLDRAYHKKEGQQDLLEELVTKTVLEFDPMDPINSLVNSAAEFIRVDPAVLLKAASNTDGGFLGGDALADFFNWNPFSDAPIDQDYNRWVAVEFLKKQTNEEFDQYLSDKRLGKELLKKLNDAFRARGEYTGPLCCAPSRDKKTGKLHFWINTGRNTQIDGSKTLEEIEAFLVSGEKVRVRR